MSGNARRCSIRITSYNVCYTKLLRVSRSTVSRVVNNYKNVPKETREKIQKTNLIYMEEWEELENWQDIVMWIWAKVYYSPDGEKDIWSTPLETLNRGKGDCEDFVILFMNIYYVRFGVKLDMVVLDMNKRTKVNGVV